MIAGQQYAAIPAALPGNTVRFKTTEVTSETPVFPMSRPCHNVKTVQNLDKGVTARVYAGQLWTFRVRMHL